MPKAKDYFNQEEWLTLQFALMWIFRGVAGADGKIDKEEQDALTKVVESYDTFREKLVREVLLSVKLNPGIVFRQSVNDRRDYKSGLKETSNLLEEKVSFDEALLFKKVLIAIGIFVASASGDSKSNISDEEVGTLSKLAHYLNLNMKELENSPTINDLLTHFED